MRNVGWTVLLVIGLIIGITLVFGGVAICYTALELIVKYVLFMLSVPVGMILAGICVILLFAD